jgi:hypothetical protein
MKRIAVIALSTLPVLAALATAATVAGERDLTVVQAERSRSGASMMSDAEIKQKLEAAGYTNVQLGEHDRSKVEVTATKNGQDVDLDVDAQSGAVSQHIEKEGDDDD